MKKIKKAKKEKVIRDGFVFYRSFYSALIKLEAEQQAKLIQRMCEYALNGKNKTSGDTTIESLFILIKPQLDANNKRYLNSLKGGAPKGSHNNPLGRNQYTKKEPTKITETIITTEENKYMA